MQQGSKRGGWRAIGAPVQFVDAPGRRIAYRSLGEGLPLVLSTRFRGTMESWDPAFLVALSERGIRPILFDHAGLGRSSGEKRYNPLEMVEDLRDLVLALALGRAAMCGWSLGGMVAQASLVTMPELVSHLVLIGTAPPGPNVKLAEQLYYDLAGAPDEDAEAHVKLYFEPTSTLSRKAAERSLDRLAQWETADSTAVPVAWAAAQLGDEPRHPIFPAERVLEALGRTEVPVLHIGGSHDVGFPVENWYPHSKLMAGLHLITLPVAGNAPHHQFPDVAAAYVAAFLNTATDPRRLD